MPIFNIIDNRRDKYRFLKLNAIVEATWHDNNCENADRTIIDRRAPDYEEREGITLNEAVSWATAMQCAVTLYLYNEGDGTTIAPDLEVFSNSKGHQAACLLTRSMEKGAVHFFRSAEEAEAANRQPKDRKQIGTIVPARDIVTMMLKLADASLDPTKIEPMLAQVREKLKL